MAAGEAEIRGHRSVFDVLIVPRPITRIGLLLVGAASSQLLWLWLSGPLLAYVSGLAGSFCLLCLGAVWTMRARADLALSGELLDADDFKKARRVARKMRERTFRRAAVVAVCAVAAASPAVAQQLTGTVWHWMVLISGVAVGESAYSCLLANAWEESLREHRDSQIEALKRREDGAALVRRAESSSVLVPTDELGNWSRSAGSLEAGRDLH